MRYSSKKVKKTEKMRGKVRLNPREGHIPDETRGLLKSALDFF